MLSIDSLNFKENLISTIKKDGYVVITNIFSNIKCDLYVNDIVSYFENLKTGVCRYDLQSVE